MTAHHCTKACYTGLPPPAFWY